MEVQPTALNVLVAATARGDRNAFEHLYRRTAPRLYALCLRVVQRSELAEEVLQEVFVRVWRDAARLQGYRADPMVWLGVMVRNRAIDMLRRGDREVTPFSDDEVVEESSPPEADPAHLTERLAANEMLHRCLEELEASRRKAILLAFFQGLSHRELADSLAEPVGTVKSWVRRGLAQLKRCLET